MEDQVKEPTGAPAPQPPPKEEPPPAVDELAKAKQQGEEYLNGWKRAMADYANLQKETLRFKDEFAKFACAGLVSDLLPVVDAFKKALAAEPKPAEGDSATKQWIDGVRNIRQQLEAVLKKAGLAAIEEAGVAFDPNLHEAMMTRRQDGAAAGQVIEVLQPGYRLNDRVIRAAKVVVAE